MKEEQHSIIIRKSESLEFDQAAPTHAALPETELDRLRREEAEALQVYQLVKNKPNIFAPGFNMAAAVDMLFYQVCWQEAKHEREKFEQNERIGVLEQAVRYLQDWS